MTNYLICYFSGTGNAKHVAKSFAKELSEKGNSCEIYEIKKSTSIQVPEFDKIIMVYPTHGFNAPPIIYWFLKRLPKVKNKEVFLLNTRAGMKLWKIFTPGLSGIALLLPALRLLLKGYKIKGVRPLDMPSNWISLHPGLRKKVVDSITQRIDKLIVKLAERMETGKVLWRGWIEAVYDLFLIPISIGYYIVGRFFLAKTFYATHSCNACGICEKQCGVGAIKMKQQKPYWTFQCESCMKCMNTCPKRAIETAHGYATLLWWAGFSFIPWKVFHWLGAELQVELPYYVFKVLDLAIGFSLLFISYQLIHYLLRYKWFSLLMKYTSLTALPFWRRYFFK
jgi:ferredoxin